ncbi:hypothetical protein BSKO_05882 [Bryopsis sp. KO-2023]|nr:hypothetical protein BSKO_05882 [Bryopsis sp. KO-2023]
MPHLGEYHNLPGSSGQAAEAEDAGAMSHLGHMYANGLGVEQNNKTALKWFEKGAGEGHPNSHYGLGYMYLAGYGVKKDLQKAFRNFNKFVLKNGMHKEVLTVRGK